MKTLRVLTPRNLPDTVFRFRAVCLNDPCPWDTTWVIHHESLVAVASDHVRQTGHSVEIQERE